MVLTPVKINMPEEYLGNYVSAPKNLAQLKFQQQSAAAMGKSMNLGIKAAQPISDMQRGVVTESEYTIPIQETSKYTGVTGLIPDQNQQRSTQQQKQRQARRMNNNDEGF